MKRPRKIPLPRKRKAEQGRAGIDRPPLRLYRTEPKYCPRHAYWVGPGSLFANPFAGDTDPSRGAPMCQLVDAAARRTRGFKRETWNPAASAVEPPPVTPDERFVARAFLYREWRAGRLDALPKDVTFRLGRLTEQLPAPPTDDDIRAALAGCDLVDATPYRLPSHADELLTVANRGVA